MKGLEAFRVALDALRGNRVRSLLTMLGIIIGVAAVVLVVSIGAGARQQIEGQVEGLGSNLILVVPGNIDVANPGRSTSAGRGSGFVPSDRALLAQVAGDPAAVTARLSRAEQVRAAGAQTYTTVQGSDQNLPAVFDRPVDEGSYLSATDVDTRRRVAVLGSGTAGALFGQSDPLGRQVTLAGVRFRVVGVLAPKGESFGVSLDNEVHIPYTTAQRLFGTSRVDAYAVKASQSDEVSALAPQIKSALEQAHPDEAFSAVTQTQILGVIGNILGLLTTVLASIAGISLLVGGVGVSNIMLVSVRERTREIGLRKALGARQGDVLSQFLVEAVLLTSAGGVIGILIGVGGSALVSQLSPLPTVVEWWSPVLAFVVSAAIGIFFGVFPARRAGRLDPVVALRAD